MLARRARGCAAPQQAPILRRARLAAPSRRRAAGAPAGGPARPPAAADDWLQPFRLSGPRTYPAADAQRISRQARPSSGEDHPGPRPAPLAAAHADPGPLAWAARVTAGHAPASLAGPRRTHDIGHDRHSRRAGRRPALSGPDLAGIGTRPVAVVHVGLRSCRSPRSCPNARSPCWWRARAPRGAVPGPCSDRSDETRVRALPRRGDQVLGREPRRDLRPLAALSPALARSLVRAVLANHRYGVLD